MQAGAAAAGTAAPALRLRAAADRREGCAPKDNASLSDQDRVAQTTQRAPERRPTASPSRAATRRVRRGGARRPRQGARAGARAVRLAARSRRGRRAAADRRPASQTPRQQALNVAGQSGRSPAAAAATSQASAAARGGRAAGGVARARRCSNLEKYVAEPDVRQSNGGKGEFGPCIQFDTKGVEFGPWIRRFVAQVKRNWFIPYAAMSLRGPRRPDLQRAQGRPHHRPQHRAAVERRRLQQRRVQRAAVVQSDARRCRPSTPPTRRSSR